MKKITYILLILLVGILLVIGCSPVKTEEDLNYIETKLKEKEDEITNLNDQLIEKEDQIKDLKIQLSQFEGETLDGENESMGLLTRAVEVMDLIKNQDMEGLAQRVDPNQGLRLSPYPYIDLNTDIVMGKEDVENSLNIDTIIQWGSYDGTGYPINLSFSDYFDSFIYDEDFINPHIIGLNNSVSSGNMYSNIEEIYPNNPYVEFHFTGFNPQYEGMDWRSLTLVFVEVDGDYYLVGLVHGQWTI